MTGFDSKRRASKDLLELQAQPAVAEPNTWREAVDNELICTHLGTADSFSDAGAALDALINWHVAVALDPEVSSAAQALVDRGAAGAEPLTERSMIKLPRIPDHLNSQWPYLPYQLRERDIEVAKVVLEAAAQAAGPDDSYRDEWFAAKADAVKRIRALEISHD